jgi:DNA-binding NarL/FixJ family response regulator
MDSVQRPRSSAISVLIAESSRLNCQLLETALRRKRRDFIVVSSALDSRQALTAIEQYRPDVAVISAHLSKGLLEGYRLLNELRSLQSTTRNVLLLDSRERDLVTDAFRCGAHGVIFRDERIETLGRCIHAVYQGQVWANSEHLGYLLDALSSTMPLTIADGVKRELLSKRQEEVVRLVAQGLTNRDVATKLGLSEHTVRNYMFQIFDRIGVSTRVELVLYYLNGHNAQHVAAD